MDSNGDGKEQVVFAIDTWRRPTAPCSMLFHLAEATEPLISQGKI